MLVAEDFMRTAVIATLLSLAALSAAAQDSPEPEKCYPVPVSGRVDVTMHAGPIRRATLLCIGDDKVMLASDGHVEAVPLADVKAIVKPADGVADGFLKGAAVAGVFSLLCWECGDAGQRVAAMAVYGAIGAGLDALHGGRETIYRRSNERRGAPPVTVAWRLRF